QTRNIGIVGARRSIFVSAANRPAEAAGSRRDESSCDPPGRLIGPPRLARQFGFALRCGMAAASNTTWPAFWPRRCLPGLGFGQQEPSLHCNGPKRGERFVPVEGTRTRSTDNRRGSRRASAPAYKKAVGMNSIAKAPQLQAPSLERASVGRLALRPRLESPAVHPIYHPIGWK